MSGEEIKDSCQVDEDASQRLKDIDVSCAQDNKCEENLEKLSNISLNNEVGDEGEDEDESDTEKEPAPDFVDEEALKDLELTISAEEREERRTKAVKLKNEGNTVFKDGQYMESLRIYTEGLNLCPLSCAAERAMLYSNRAACKAKLGNAESAIEDCTQAIELNGTYIRALLRRAQLYEQTDKLDEALGDYKQILELDPTVAEARAAVVRLPPEIEVRNEKMKTEMLGKLKDLGNMFLKPFGLSTDNFKMQQDPNTGGYSVNFSQK